MNITRKSILTGIERTLDLPVTQEQIDAWENGELIQKAMPKLTPDQREFIKTGITAEECADVANFAFLAAMARAFPEEESGEEGEP